MAAPTSTDKVSSPSNISFPYSAAVVLDLATSWFRLIGHFSLPAMLFHLVETLIKGSVLAFVIRGSRTALFLQMALSSLALLSGFALQRQANHRAAQDVLVWVSLAAQVFAGGCCIFILLRSKRA